MGAASSTSNQVHTSSLFKFRSVSRELTTPNDRLVDNLVCRKYITHGDIEDAFKSVDRQIFYPDDSKDLAYNHHSWRNDDFGLEAPRVYAKLINIFELKKGLSFLNVPLGSGYVNAIAGFLLGTYGKNHGLDLSDAAISSAESNMRSFLATSEDINRKDFCFPVFEKGNVLSMELREYDRILCGLSCPPDYVMFLKQRLSVGGILIVMQQEGFFKITKLEDNIWQEFSVFAMRKKNLTLPNAEDEKLVMPRGPPSLMELSRLAIRDKIQKIMKDENRGFAQRPSLLEYVRRCHKPSSLLQLRVAAQVEAHPELTELQFLMVVLREIANKSSAERSSQRNGLDTMDSVDGGGSDVEIDMDDILNEYKEELEAYVEANAVYGPYNESFEGKIKKIPLPESLACYLLYRGYIPPADE